jgi:hypothetical protein
MAGETQVEIAVREVVAGIATYAEGEARLTRLIREHDDLATRHRRLAEDAVAFLRRARDRPYGRPYVARELGKLLRDDPGVAE